MSGVGTTCDGDEFTFAYDGAGNLATLSRWDAAAATVETVAYRYNGANQIACLDADLSGACDNGEAAWVYDAYGSLTGDRFILGAVRVMGETGLASEPVRWAETKNERLRAAHSGGDGRI